MTNSDTASKFIYRIGITKTGFEAWQRGAYFIVHSMYTNDTTFCGRRVFASYAYLPSNKYNYCEKCKAQTFYE